MPLLLRCFLLLGHHFYCLLNYLIFTFGLISISSGYLVMAKGDVDSFQSLTLAPIFLFLGYIILIPISLLIKRKEN